MPFHLLQKNTAVSSVLVVFIMNGLKTAVDVAVMSVVCPSEGVLRYGDERRGLDRLPAALQRQRGFPEELEGVQDGQHTSEPELLAPVKLETTKVRSDPVSNRVFLLLSGFWGRAGGALVG